MHKRNCATFISLKVDSITPRKYSGVSIYNTQSPCITPADDGNGDVVQDVVWQTKGPPVSSERRNKRNRTTAAPDEKDTQWSAEGVADGQVLLVRLLERERERVCVCVLNARKWTGGKECLIDG